MKTKPETDEISRKRNIKNRFLDAPSYVGYWIDREGVVVTAKQEINSSKRRLIGSSLLEKIELAYDKERREAAEGQKGFPNFSKLLSKALNQYMEDVLFRTMEEMKERLAFDLSLSKRDSLRGWLRAVTGKDDDINLAVMSHCIWMVKRNLHGRSVQNHIMPIVYGPQGYGKSKAILSLLGPIMDLVGLVDLDDMTDPKMAHSTKDLLVGFIDEMRQANKVDVDSLKNLITTPHRFGRRAYSPMADHLPNITSLIGATNKHIQDIIRDDTGMRRFFVMDAPARCDWEVINSLDYEAVWRSIDEHDPDGYLFKEDLSPTDDGADSLANRQQEYSDKHPAVQWLEECMVAPAVGEPTEYISDTLALAELVNFMERSGIKLNVSKNALTRKVSFALGKKREVRVGTDRNYGWDVNSRRSKYSPLPIFTREIKSYVPS